MADTPSTIVLPDAATLDGTEHLSLSQSGNVRRVTVSVLLSKLSPATLILPLADPHVVGALWNNAGTITISAG